jgi:hypothetical protein
VCLDGRQLRAATSAPPDASSPHHSSCLPFLSPLSPQEELDNQLLQPAPVPSTKVPSAGQALPSVPTGAAKSKQKTQEELELEALQAEMAL